MIKNFLINLKNETLYNLYLLFVLLYSFLAVVTFWFAYFDEMNILKLFGINELYAYFWIEVSVGVCVISCLIIGGFLYAFLDVPKSEISLILFHLLFFSFSFLLIASLLAGWKYNFFYNTYILFFNNYCMFASYTYFLKIWVIFFSLVSLTLSNNFLIKSNYNLVEFPILIGFTSFLLLILVSLIDLFALFVVIESLFFLLMCLSTLKFSSVTVEACIKYFVQNVFVSGLGLLGLLIVYSVCKSTNLYAVKGVLLFQLSCSFDGKPHVFFFLIFGLILFFLTFLFKIGLFPVHFYVSDIYEASAYSVIFFFSAVVKPVFLLFFLKLFDFFILNFFYFSVFLYVVSFFSVLIGLIGALQQTNIKRFLGYTSINQLGFLTFCYVCNPGNWAFISIYLFIYILFQIPFFLIMTYLADLKQYSTLTNFSDLNSLAKFSFFKYIFSLSFFFISGLPPFLLFLYKYILLTQSLASGYFMVVVFIIFMNIISLVYYLKIIKTVLFEEQNLLSLNTLSVKNFDASKQSNKTIEINKIILLNIILHLIFIIFFSVFLFINFDAVEYFIYTNFNSFFVNVFV